MKPIIAITIGDPVGIGPEVIVKAFQTEALYAVCRPVVIGLAQWMTKAATDFSASLSIRPVKTIKQCRFKPGTLEVKEPAGDSPSCSEWQYGQSNPDASRLSIHAIEEAARLALKKEVNAITTAPINKEGLKKVGFAHPGHTEFLAHLAGTKKFAMMMVGGGAGEEPLKIVLATIHLPLREVIQTIRKEVILEKIRLTDAALKRDFGLPHGKIAVASLNPHAGERGLFGTEEIEEVIPAVLSAQAKRRGAVGINVSGPYPADTLFYHLRSGRFDAAVALYHDQALIPIKLLAFGNAVNVTIGLPFIRTSVDHGTAYDIAGKGMADPGSLETAVRLAAKMAAYRSAR